MAKLERDFQSQLIRKISDRLPGSYIFKLDTRFRQGSPDLLILYSDRWAVLEVKKSANEPKQPNQEFYVGELNAMSYSAFIYPENEEDILDEVQRTLQD